MSTKKKPNAFVFDIETDGLYDEVTKIHCLSYIRLGDSEVKSITDMERIKQFFLQDDLTLLGHNIVVYDIPTVKKVLDFDFTPKRTVDTLGISWYLNSSKDASFKHGLEYYGERFGIPKPKIDDWENLTVEDYVFRCQEDVKINYKLWLDQQAQLKYLYEDDWREVFRLIDYITLKLDVVAEQQENRTLLDTNLINYEINRLSAIAKESREELLSAMPKQPIKSKKSKPKNVYKQDGELTTYGAKWFEFLKELGLPESTEGDVTYISGYDDPNPDSMVQIKDWLFSLGWEPQHFKYIRDKKTNEFRTVPQITNERDGTELCESVLKLSEKVPEINALAGYSTVKHRIKLFEGFLRDMDSENRLQWDAGGFTNTFRLKHRKVVNLPNPKAPFAENIRAVFIADTGEYLVGSDLSGIEDATKQHYIFPFDPDYVKSMQTEDWDAHLDVCIRAGLLSEEQVEDHKSGKVLYKEERQKGKTVNFSATYKVGAKTLARTMKVPESEAKKILDAYWERNWAIKSFEKTCTVKSIGDQMWVKQPISGFWYTLRTQKDIFSTVNQGTAVYVFDIWCKHLRELGIRLSGTYHDEVVLRVPFKERSFQETRDLIGKSMELVNEELKLNVEVKCSVDFGRTYLDVH